MNNLILASSSPYRKTLLERLQLPFSCAEPDIDETPKNSETAIELVQRLSRQKAMAVTRQHPNHLIIGSDQVALLNGKLLTKPGNFANAHQQLQRQSGQCVQFHTGLSLYNSNNQQCEVDVITTEVTFRTLTDAAIKHYLNAEQPWHCAGSFKAEGLGISLFDKISSSDPTALIGLPLMRLCQMLRQQNIKI